MKTERNNDKALSAFIARKAEIDAGWVAATGGR